MKAVAPAPVAAFLGELRDGRRASPHTVLAYRRDLATLVALLRDAAVAPDLSRVTAADARRLAARLHGQGLEPPSIARALSAWRAFYDWWMQHDPAAAPAVNPILGLRPPRRADRLPTVLSADQAVQLAGAPTDGSPLALRDRAMVELLYSSGLRLAELVGLDCRYHAAERAAAGAGTGTQGGAVGTPRAPGTARPASLGTIDLEARTVTVTGKGRRTRTVPIGAAACAALRAWLAARATLRLKDPRALFVSSRGTRISHGSVAARVAKLGLAQGIGVHVHPHMLRHAMASHLLQSSGDLRAVQEMLGHASVATTQIYTRLDWQHLAKTYDAAHPRARRRS
jgi:integrase/recombinase XerC